MSGAPWPAEVQCKLTPGLEGVFCAIGLTIASVDLVVVRIISFELLYGRVVLQHGRRRLVRVGVMLLRGDEIQPSSLFASALSVFRLAHHPDIRDSQDHENQSLHDADDCAQGVEGQWENQLG
jgi:hypothetical protein